MFWESHSKRLRSLNQDHSPLMHLFQSLRSPPHRFSWSQSHLLPFCALWLIFEKRICLHQAYGSISRVLLLAVSPFCNSLVSGNRGLLYLCRCNLPCLLREWNSSWCRILSSWQPALPLACKAELWNCLKSNATYRSVSQGYSEWHGL